MSATAWLEGISKLPAGQWNSLEGESAGHPFTRHAFLAGLESFGCIHPGIGWQPLTPVVEERGRILAAAPAYIKTNSHGEFVFDWAWADAWHRAGKPWYPKLLVACPYTPVTGPRLLGAAANPSAGRTLIDSLEQKCHAAGLSSAHVNFCRPHEADLLRRAGWLERFDWQYHWHNAGYRDFQDFLDALRSKPRKNIRRERRNVAARGWQFRWMDGTEIGEEELSFVYRCYRGHFLFYGNRPVLNREFFDNAARSMGRDFQVCLVLKGDGLRAAAVFFSGDNRLYGRYWGSEVDEKDLHFETCYYQGIERAIDQGLSAFEPGAQGEHKIRRGFLPVRTHSFHYIVHEPFRAAISRWLEHEARALNEIRPRLDALSPFPRSEEDP